MIQVNHIHKKFWNILGVANNSAPSAWPFRGNIIGFSRFWRKLVIFCTRDIYQIQRPFIKKYSRFWTIILWRLLHRLVWVFFYFLCFFRFNRVYLGIWYFFCFFIFLLNTTWSSEYTWVDFILMQASDWPWKEVGARASQRESQPFVGNKPIESLHKYEINPRVFTWPWSIQQKNKKSKKVPNTRDKRG